MNKASDFGKPTFLGALAAAILAVGCAAPNATRQPATAPTAASNANDKTTPSYVTAGDIKAMAPCTATFAKRLSEFSGSFTTADGRPFVVGDIRGEQWVWHFVCALKEGKTYRFPDAFLKYQAAPHYVSAKEIAAMPPCTATLASRTPCSSYFLTSDGNWFGIGDPGSGVQVSQFISSLKDEETCKFPDVFLDYANRHVPDK